MRRELNELEYLNWCIDQPYNMAIAVRIHGTLAPDRLRTALDKVQCRHPLLTVTTVVDDRRIPWFDSDGIGAIPLQVIERAGDDHAARLLDQELGAIFDMNAGLPLLRATLVAPRNSGEPTDLLLCAQHVIADGMSMLFLTRDLLRLVERPEGELAILDAPASAEDLLPPEVRRRVPRSAFKLRLSLAALRAYRWFKGGKASEASTARDLASRLHSWRLTPEETHRLLVRCKVEGVSVQSALCTSFLASYPAINSPVNLRSRLARPVGESIGLYVGSAIVKMKFVERRGFWPNAREYHRRFRRALADPFQPFRFCSKAVPVETVRAFGAIIVALTTQGRPFAITNLGALDEKGLDLTGGTLRVESVVGGVTGIIGASVLTVYTLGGSMHFHLSSPPSLPPEEAAVSSSRAMALLRSALESPAAS